jgi:hypothetical protein
MAGKTGPNHPHGFEPVDKVRQLQRQLYVSAKRSKGRRFHALFDRIHRNDVLWEAWERVRRNKGSAGVDAQTLVEIESYGVERFVEELQSELVVVCASADACEEAERRIKMILHRLSLELHPEKTRRLNLSLGQEGFDFLGCHLRKRMSGRILEKQGRKVYFLQRWPSDRSMKRVKQRVRELTGRNRHGVKDAREIVKALNPVLRGWGNYFRTGNAAQKFNQLDTHVWRRLLAFMVKRKGRNLRAGEALLWDREFFYRLGLHRLLGTVQYPEAA